MKNRFLPAVRGFIVVSAALMLFGAFLALLKVDIPSANRDVVMVIIGALITRSEKIDSFFFGSSQSSDEKTKILAERPKGTPTDPVHTEEDNPLGVWRAKTAKETNSDHS